MSDTLGFNKSLLVFQIYLDDVLSHVGVTVAGSSPPPVFPRLDAFRGAPIMIPLSPAIDGSPTDPLAYSESLCIPTIAPLTDVD